MKTFYSIIFLFLLCIQPVFAQTTVKEDESVISLENRYLSIDFNKKRGTFRIHDKTGDVTVIDNAYFAADGWKYNSRRAKGIIYSFTTGKMEGNIKGKSLTVNTVHTTGKLLPEYKWKFSLPDDGKYVVFNMGVKNTLPNDMRFTRANALLDAKLFPKQEMSEVKTLNGAAGKTNAAVWPDTSRTADNSMLLTCMVNGKRHSIVWGGLRYSEFYATTEYNKEKQTINLEMSDPTGKLVEKGKEWWTTDSYYVGIGEADPFVALENYALCVRDANNAHPHNYNFPSLCGWGVGHLSHGKNVNNSVDLVTEADGANTNGLTRYTKVAIRLEPDYYCYITGDTEQGWWDDEHWAKFGHLKKPYDTFAKWCKEILSRNALPFTYFQCSMPSDDFARTYPQWMLGNEDVISKIHLYHNHHQPYVRYDYTDKGFQQHMKKVWNNLRMAGMQGIKFDYPESAWNIYGGFDDKTATSTSAYRTVFQLCRDGLGKEARLTERNLGESGAPCLDVTAGIIDLQRVTGDNNKFDPQHISTVGLRWYKARSVFNYYTDSKNLLPLEAAQRQSLITMTALTSGMFELSTSFQKFTPEMVYEVSRMYPVYDGIKSPRPVDAFTGVKYPQIYDLELEKGWHQLALFNSDSKTKTITVQLGKDMISGGLNLDPSKKYYVYDFWNGELKGIFSGNGVLSTELGTLECAMYSVKEVVENPQIIHTNRHIMQGWMDTEDVRWNASANMLEGTSLTAEGEQYRMVIALNGMKKIKGIHSDTGRIKVVEYSKDGRYATIAIDSKGKNTDVAWQISFR